MFVDHFPRPPLAATRWRDQEEATVERAKKSYAYGLLKGMWGGK